MELQQSMHAEPNHANANDRYVMDNSNQVFLENPKKHNKVSKSIQSKQKY
jgi:hypothetical protein